MPALAIKPLAGLSHASTKEEHSKCRQRNKHLRERVEGTLVSKEDSYNGTVLNIKIKPGRGFAYEHWQMPYNRLISIPRYVKNHIVENMKLYNWKNSEVSPNNLFAVPYRAEERSRVEFLSK